MYGVTAAGNQLIAAGNQSNVYIYKKKKVFLRRYV